MEVEGIPFYIRKDLLKNNYEIDWLGLWILGRFLVKITKRQSGAR